jgi:hypothetical protein
MTSKAILHHAFVSFLKNESAYENYVRNLYEKRKMTIAELINHNYMNGSVIDYTLTWSLTPEGTTYWSDLNGKWHNIFESLKELL